MTDELMDPEQEAHLLEDPYDWKAWKAYAAWLTEHGEPRGELIRELALGPGREAAVRLISANWPRWFGALPPASVACEWSDGFVRELKLKADVPPALTGRTLFSRHTLGFPAPRPDNSPLHPARTVVISYGQSPGETAAPRHRQA